MQPLAWLVKPAFPGTRVTFKWSETYNFAWSEVEQLKSGVVFEASQVAAADPMDNRFNSVRLTYRQNALSFTEARCKGTEGSLLIEQDDTLPLGLASVGIGMNGCSVLAVPAQPNMNLVIRPEPTYFVTAGWKNQGEVMELVELTQPAEVKFPRNIHRLAATLSNRNTWSVSGAALSCD